MKKSPRREPKSCSVEGCSVRDARYIADGKRMCAKHAKLIWRERAKDPSWRGEIDC